MEEEYAKGRIGALDGLRAIAIIFVLLRHAFKPLAEQYPDYFMVFGYNLLTPFLNGWLGVDLFFVLSGFLITLTFIKHVETGGKLRIYALKRFLRIAPAYYVTLCMVSAVALLTGKIAAANLGFSVFYHILFLQDYLPANLNVVFWSLGVEEKFYIIATLLLPFLLFVNRRYRMKAVIASIVFFILVGIALRYISYIMAGYPDGYVDFFYSTRSPFHCCFDPLLIGVLIALIFKDRSNSAVVFTTKAAKRIFLVSFCALILLVLSHVLLDYIGLYDALIQPLLIAVIMGGMVLGAVFGGGFKWLESKVMYKISVLSYSLYLVHLPLLPLGFGFAKILSQSEGVSLPFIAIFLISYAIISVSFALILHHAVEKPFLRIKGEL